MFIGATYITYAWHFLHMVSIHFEVEDWIMSWWVAISPFLVYNGSVVYRWVEYGGWCVGQRGNTLFTIVEYTVFEITKSYLRVYFTGI